MDNCFSYQKSEFEQYTIHHYAGCTSNFEKSLIYPQECGVIYHQNAAQQFQHV